MVLAICIGVPVLFIGLAFYLRSQYGEELFGLRWPGHDLNESEDYRLIKLRLRPPPESKEE